MSSKVTFKGLNDLHVQITKSMNLDDVKQVIKKNGAELNQKMQKYASPQGAFTKGYSVGTTRRSITIELSDNGMTATVEPHTDYSQYLEYGTRFMEAEPFVSPAFNDQKEVFLKDMKKIMG